MISVGRNQLVSASILCSFILVFLSRILSWKRKIITHNKQPKRFWFIKTKLYLTGKTNYCYSMMTSSAFFKLIWTELVPLSLLFLMFGDNSCCWLILIYFYRDFTMMMSLITIKLFPTWVMFVFTFPDYQIWRELELFIMGVKSVDLTLMASSALFKLV